jgi:DNA-binding response OmpR family regulator
MPKGQERDLILIVEDDQEVSDMLCTYLRTKRYRLATTPMGRDVLVLCQVERPNLILLDINLPDMDGYQVCRLLRDNLATSTLPILFLTQRRQRQERLEGLNVGADDYITKPFDVEELHLRVRNALRRSKHQAGIGQISRLPEGPLVSEQLKKLLYGNEWAVLSIYVENFSRFTDAYHRLKDKFIHYVGQLVRQSVDEVGNFDDFVGRVGTVDYIVITTPHRVSRLQESLETKFTRAMNPQNDTSDARPITAYLDLSFGVVTDQDGPFGDIRSLAVAISGSRNSGLP